MGMTHASVRIGKLAEAEPVFLKAREVHPDLIVTVVQIMLMRFNEEGLTDYIDTLRKAGLPEA